ncbi:MAG: hypothetical protein ACLGIK_07105 [Gemmatimonadota bacterium]
MQREPRTSLRAPHLPSLSVVLLSHGDRSELERALAAVAGRCRRMEAEIIVVRESSKEDLATLGAAYPSVTFLSVPQGTASAEMREAGMSAACGDIVALRQDGAVADGLWLEAFDATVGSVDSAGRMEVEVELSSDIDEPAAHAGDRRRSRSYLAPSVAASPKRWGDGARTVAGVRASDAESPSAGLANQA